MIKKSFLLLLVLVSTVAFAQRKTYKQPYNLKRNTVYLDVFGTSGVAGVYYDTRFSKNTKWGYRVGLSYHYSKENINSTNFLSGIELPFVSYSESSRAVFAPFEVNRLVGKRIHFFEFGFGGAVGYVHQTVKMKIKETVEIKTEGRTTTVAQINDVKYKYTEFASYANMIMGYRLQTRGGFTFRIGISPVKRISGDYISDGIKIVPYLGFGYSF